MNTPWQPLLESSASFCENRHLGCNKRVKDHKLAAHREICQYKVLPCFLGEDCGHAVVPLVNYARHLIDVHEVSIRGPVLPLFSAPFQVKYSFNGTDLSSSTMIWKYFGVTFVPVARFRQGEFSFGVVSLNPMMRQEGTFTVKIYLQPMIPKLFFRNELKFNVPVSRMAVSSDGCLEAPTSVVLTKSMLEQFCLKTGKNERWEWIVRYKVKIAD